MEDQVNQNIFSIDTESVIPLYHQIKQNLHGLIEDGILKAAQLLPSERDLAQIYGVNRLTVRRAVGELVNEGVLRRQRGIGTFVADPKLTQAMYRVQGFSERAQDAGRRPSSRLISMDTLPARTKVAQRLNIEPDTLVFKLVRLRCAEEEPVMLETAFLPHEQFPGLETIDFSKETLYRVLAEEFECYPVESEETLEPVILTAYERQVLETDADTPGLLVQAVTQDQHGRIVEFSTAVVRGDKSRYYFRINRSSSNS
ncbi:MAG: GntR family transcriptional regulator [Chloroflexi bacterium]|nr:GntR family transcriptional regulator [Chloroflexota bacterium]